MSLLRRQAPVLGLLRAQEVARTLRPGTSEPEILRTSGMTRLRWALLGAATTLVAAGCGGGSSPPSRATSAPPDGSGSHRVPVRSHTVATSPAPDKGQQGHIIKSFDPELVKDGVVRLHWILLKPAALTVAVDGVSHGHTHGQAAGRFPVPPSYEGKPHPRPKGPGTARINFEFGEANFTAYDRIQFRLRALSHGVGDASGAVVLSRSRER